DSCFFPVLSNRPVIRPNLLVDSLQIRPNVPSTYTVPTHQGQTQNWRRYPGSRESASFPQAQELLQCGGDSETKGNRA
ncbi:hypothetical protein E4U41_005815, partial [Claviceps citrina]